MTNLHVDPEALRGTRSRFDDESNTVKTAVSKLRQVINAEGKCWGNDETGQAFAKDYEKSAEDELKNIDGLAGVFTNLGAAVVKIADGLQSQDKVNADKTSKLKS
ncbi:MULTISPECIES: WXG100 family type VII secretion target [unclassified Nocardia]|uniref:WXG100 family type VII secretion target n=1 Tax=unclassified Nocardia TaxID=2637762 RepID=UPI001CE4AE7A|nr:MULTISPECIES: WXG100 family type VII secretion target [unclassified Nocardia]